MPCWVLWRHAYNECLINDHKGKAGIRIRHTCIVAASRLASAGPSPSMERTAGSSWRSSRPMKRSVEACGRCPSRDPSLCTRASHARGAAATAGQLSAASVKASSSSSSLHGASACRQHTSSSHTPAHSQLCDQASAMYVSLSPKAFVNKASSRQFQISMSAKEFLVTWE